MAKKLTRDEVINGFRKVHGDKYDYSMVKYVNTRTKVDIYCPKHGMFSQTPNSHRNGSGCKSCGRKKAANSITIPFDEILKRFRDAHGGYYDYSKIIYKNSRHPIEIVCPKHGSFFQSAQMHFAGQKCPQCAKIKAGKKRALSQSEVLERFKEVHGDYYDYSLVIYKNGRDKIKIICPTHGVFKQGAESHMYGSGCPKCAQSRGEKRVALFLDSYGIKYEVQKRFEKCKHEFTLPFDFYIPVNSILIEYQGEQHYRYVKTGFFGGIEGLKARQRRDQIKRDFAKEYNFYLIEIPYTKFETLESYLFEQLNKIQPIEIPDIGDVEHKLPGIQLNLFSSSMQKTMQKIA